jgi:hypothetical protein
MTTLSIPCQFRSSYSAQDHYQISTSSCGLKTRRKSFDEVYDRDRSEETWSQSGDGRCLLKIIDWQLWSMMSSLALPQPVSNRYVANSSVLGKVYSRLFLHHQKAFDLVNLLSAQSTLTLEVAFCTPNSFFNMSTAATMLSLRVLAILRAASSFVPVCLITTLTRCSSQFPNPMSGSEYSSATTSSGTPQERMQQGAKNTSSVFACSTVDDKCVQWRWMF